MFDCPEEGGGTSKPYSLLLKSDKPFPSEFDAAERIKKATGLTYPSDFKVRCTEFNLEIRTKDEDTYKKINSIAKTVFTNESISILLNYELYDFTNNNREICATVGELSSAIQTVILGDSQLVWMKRFGVRLKSEFTPRLRRKNKIGLEHDLLVLGFNCETKQNTLYLSLEKNQSRILAQISASSSELSMKAIERDRNSCKQYNTHNTTKVEKRHSNFPKCMPTIKSIFDKWNEHQDHEHLQNKYSLLNYNCQHFVERLWMLIESLLPNQVWFPIKSFENYIATNNDELIKQKFKEISECFHNHFFVNFYGEIGCGKSSAVLKTLHPINLHHTFVKQLHLDASYLTKVSFKSSEEFISFVWNNLCRLEDKDKQQIEPLTFSNSMVFIDNMEHIPNSDSYFEKILDMLQNSFVLVTSQQTLNFFSDNVCLHEFSKSECRIFLQENLKNLTKIDLLPHQLDKIGRFCQNSPLYLKFAVPFLRSSFRDENYRQTEKHDDIIDTALNNISVTDSTSERRLSIAKDLDHMKANRIDEWLVLEAASLLNGEFELKDFEEFVYIEKSLDAMKNSKFWPIELYQHEHTLLIKAQQLEKTVESLRIAKTLEKIIDVLVQNNFLKQTTPSRFMMNIFVREECLKKITNNPFTEYKQQFVLLNLKQSLEATDPSSYLLLCRNIEFMIAALNGQITEEKLRIQIQFLKDAIEKLGIYRLPATLITIHDMISNDQSEILIKLLKESAETGNGLLERSLDIASMKLREIVDYELHEVNDGVNESADSQSKMNVQSCDSDLEYGSAFECLFDFHYELFRAESDELDESFEEELERLRLSMKDCSKEADEQMSVLISKIKSARQLFQELMEHFQSKRPLTNTFLKEAFKSGNKSLRRTALQLYQEISEEKEEDNEKKDLGLKLVKSGIWTLEKMKEVIDNYGIERVLSFQFDGVLSSGGDYSLFDGCYPLHLAVYASIVSIVEFLLNLGADVNARDKWNLSPLHYAVIESNKEVISLLLKVGAIWTKDDRREFCNSLETIILLLEQSLSQKDVLKKIYSIEFFNKNANASQEIFETYTCVQTCLKLMTSIKQLIQNGGKINIQRDPQYQDKKPVVYYIVKEKQHINRMLGLGSI